MVSAFLRRCWESVIGLRREQEHDSPESPLGMHWGFRFLERSASDSRTRNMSEQPLLAPSFLLPPPLLFRPCWGTRTESSFCCFALRFLSC